MEYSLMPIVADAFNFDLKCRKRVLELIEYHARDRSAYLLQRRALPIPAGCDNLLPLTQFISITRNGQ